MEIESATPSPLGVPRRCLLCRADFVCSADEDAFAVGGRSDMERLSAVVDAAVVLCGGAHWWGSKLLCHDCDFALDEISRALKNRLTIRRCFMKNVAALHGCDVFVPALLRVQPVGPLCPTFDDDDDECGDGSGWQGDCGGVGEDVGHPPSPPLVHDGGAATGTAADYAETRARRAQDDGDEGGGSGGWTEDERRERVSPCSPVKRPPTILEERKLGGGTEETAAVPSAFSAVQKQGHIIMPRDSQGHLENLKDTESGTNYSETPGGFNCGLTDRCRSLSKRKSAADDGMQVEASARPGPGKLSRRGQTPPSAHADGSASSTSSAAAVAAAAAAATGGPSAPLLSVEQQHCGSHLSAAASDAQQPSGSASSALRRLSMVLGAGLTSAYQATRRDEMASPSSSSTIPLEAVARTSEMAPAVRASCTGRAATATSAAASAGELRCTTTADEPVGSSELLAASRQAAASSGKPLAAPNVVSGAGSTAAATSSRALDPESPVACDRAGSNSSVGGLGQTVNVTAHQLPASCGGPEVRDDTDSRQVSVSSLQLIAQTAPLADTAALGSCGIQKQSCMHTTSTDCASEHSLASPPIAGQALSAPAQQHMALSCFLASLAQPRPQLHQQPQSAHSLPMAVSARKTNGLHARSTPPATCNDHGTGRQMPPTNIYVTATGPQQQQLQRPSTATAVLWQLPVGSRSEHYSPVPTTISAVSAVPSCRPLTSISACLSRTAPERASSHSSAPDSTAPGPMSNLGKSAVDSQAYGSSLQQPQLSTSSAVKFVVPAAASSAVEHIHAPAASGQSGQVQVTLQRALVVSSEQQNRSKSPAVACIHAAAAAATSESLAAAKVAQASADLPSPSGKESIAVKQGPLKHPERASAMSTLWKLLQQPAQPSQDQSSHGSAASASSSPVHNSASLRPVHDRDTAAACRTPVSDHALLSSNGGRTPIPAPAAASIRDATAAPLSYLVRSAAARALVEAPLSAMRSAVGSCRSSPGAGCGGGGGSSFAAGATMPLLAGMFEKLCEPPPPLPPSRSSMQPAAAAGAVSAARRPLQPPPPAQSQRPGAVSPPSRLPQETLPHPHRRLRRYSSGHRYQRSPSNGGLGHTSFSNDPCRRRLIRTAAVQRLSPNVFGSSSVHGKMESMEADAYTDEHEGDSFVLQELEHPSYERQGRVYLSPAGDASATCSSAVDLSSETFFSPSHLELKSEPVDV